MLQSIPPVLITTCIIPTDCNIRLVDPNKRLFHTIEAIEYWSTVGSNIRIIVCDGSNFNYSEILRIKFPNVEIEFLHFQTSEISTKLKGKGFGEGEIINFALENSIILMKSESFIKCTGKLWIENIMQMVDNYRSPLSINAHFDHIFSLKSIKLRYLDTRFYIVNKNFYKQYLSNAHLECNSSEGINLEHIFLEIMINLNEKYFIFKKNPIIQGVGGGSGEYYKNNLKRRLKGNLKKFIVSNFTKYANLIAST
jgi:hypothetical protein